MGGNSTSHSAVLTDKKTQSSGAFDLQSWQGLTELLKTGKEALKDAAEYAAFRNLVLQYAQHGGDIELKQKILTVVRSFKEAPTQDSPSTTTIAPSTETTPAQKPEASFLPHVDTPETVKKPQDERPAPTRRLLPRFEENIKREHSKSAPVVQKRDSQHTAPTPQPVAPQPLTQPVAPMVSKIEDVAPTPSVPHTPEPAQPEVAFVAPSLDNHKARIAEIKNSVHSLFGNPAALMNLHNSAGQIYMKALLMAMKATGPGSDENADIRMAELEKAYQTLTEENKPDAVAAPVQIPEAKEEKEIVVESEPLVEKEIPSIEEVAVPSISVHEEIIPITTHEEINSSPEETVEQKQESTYSAKHTLEQLSSRANQLRKTEFVPEDEKIDLKEIESFTPHHITPLQTETSNAREDLSRTNIPYKSVVDRPSVPEINTKQSELVSEEISSALKKLLHDWSIFEGSGLFGIGPGGIDHPLYQKLAPLSMGEVIAGRWERSDPKITKTIKDYVDAWRHEQGIAYTITETFEHYLRRVIQRILKRQQTQ